MKLRIRRCKQRRFKELVGSAHFTKLGLTDNALLDVGAKFLIITADLSLHKILRAEED